MKKFKVKNRQKRKYTRHTVPQSTFSLRTLAVGLLPLLILAVAFGTTLLMNLNLREQTSSIPNPTLEIPTLTLPTIVLPTFTAPTFQAPIITFPTFTLPTVTTPEISFPEVSTPKPNAPDFSGFTNFLQLIISMFLKAFIAFLVIPDSRPFWAIIVQALSALSISMGLMGNLTLNGFVRVGDLLLQSISLVGTNIAAGSQTISAAAIEYAIRAGQILATSSLFIFEKTIWLFMVLLNGTITVLLFIVHAVSAFADGVVRVVMIPFQVLGAFWLKIKPYVDILGAHMGMAGADLANGVDSFNELGEAMK